MAWRQILWLNRRLPSTSLPGIASFSSKSTPYIGEFPFFFFFFLRVHVRVYGVLMNTETACVLMLQ